MPFSRQTSVPPDPRIVEDLRTPEEIAEARRRRLLWASAAILVLLGAAMWFGAKPADHALKAWQARRAAASARQLIDQEQWAKARIKVTDALTLWPEEPEAIQAAALLLTRVGSYSQAAPFWRELERARPLTAPEQLDYAAAELALGDLDAAEARLHRAWPASQAGTPADWLMGVRLDLRRNRKPEAIELSKRLLASGQITARERLEAAMVLLSSGAGNDQASGWQQVLALAQGGKSAESLDALLLLARRATAGSASPASAGPPPAPALPALPEIIARIEAHPLARVQHQLLALDLRAIQDPAKRAELIQLAVDKYANGNSADLAALSAWLYSKGEFARVLAILPLSKAITDRALFFQYLDTLGALNRWDEIRDLIKTQKFPLDPMIQEMYLARCADQLGEPQVRDLHWKGALAAAGSNVENLLTLGRYAGKNGAADIAEAAFRAAVQAEPGSRDAHEALIQLLESRGETRALRDAVRAMAALWPQDRAARNDAAYLDALLNENVPAALAAARELVAAEPTSLPHRSTLALAELRSGNGLAALDAFAGVGPLGDSAQPRSRAVYAAVLWDTSYNQEAKAALKDLPPDRLLPEERDLVRPIEESGQPGTAR
jgi:hypothetical protein